jgi:hypothetical protein
MRGSERGIPHGSYDSRSNPSQLYDSQSSHYDRKPSDSYSSYDRGYAYGINPINSYHDRIDGRQLGGAYDDSRLSQQYIRSQPDREIDYRTGGIGGSAPYGGSGRSGYRSESDGSYQSYEYGRGKPSYGRMDSSAKYAKYSPPRNSQYRVVVTGSSIPICSWQDLKDFCRAVGDVCFADVRREREYATVEYKREEDMRRAIQELDGVVFKGAVINVKADTPEANTQKQSHGQ